MDEKQKERKHVAYIKIVIRILLGAIFIVSAITKMLSIDSFEIFIFSFGIMSLNLSFLVARLVISAEISLGLMLITGWRQKLTVVLSMTMLTVFTGFIIYLILSAKADHCYCFGDIIKMSNPASVIKNIVLAGLLLISTPSREIRIKHRTLIFSVLVVISLTIPMALTPPAFLVNNWYAKRITYNEQLFYDFIKESPRLASGKKVIAFFGTGCIYCKMAAQKISVIATKSGKEEHFEYIFWGKEEEVENFFIETGSVRFNSTVLDADKFLKIINGRMPLIILVDNGIIAGKYSFAIIDDKAISSFLE